MARCSFLGSRRNCAAVEAGVDEKGWVVRAMEAGDQLRPVKVSVVVMMVVVVMVVVVEAGTTALMLAGDGGQEEIEFAGVDVVDCCQKESSQEYELLNLFGVLKGKGVDGVLKLNGGRAVVAD